MAENNNGFENVSGKVGYASIPSQKAKTIYYYGTALTTGTVFPSLNYPKGEYGPKENFYVVTR